MLIITHTQPLRQLELPETSFPLNETSIKICVEKPLSDKPLQPHHELLIEFAIHDLYQHPENSTLEQLRLSLEQWRALESIRRLLGHRYTLLDTWFPRQNSESLRRHFKRRCCPKGIHLRIDLGPKRVAWRNKFGPVPRFSNDDEF